MDKKILCKFIKGQIINLSFIVSHMYLIIIFTLNVSRCRMSDCPNIENSFKNLLYTALLKKSHHRAHTGNVDMNLSVKKENNHVIRKHKLVLKLL